MSGTATLISGITLVLAAISVHEFAHAWAANALGDATARYRGRVTLDPLAHLDPVGTAMILFSTLSGVGIGWGRPVPVVPANFRRNPPLGLAITSASGPLSNLAQAAVAAALLGMVRLAVPAFPDPIEAVSNVLVVLSGIVGLAAGGMLVYQWYRQRSSLQPGAYGRFAWRVVDPRPGSPWWENEEWLKQAVRGGLAGGLLFGFLAGPQRFLMTAVFVNIALALFNLIPLGPLDGSGILRGLLLSSRAGWTYRATALLDRIEPYSSYILFGLILMEQMLHIPILSRPLSAAAGLIARLLGV